MKTPYLAIFAVSSAIFVSCENPADKTTSAEVGEAVEKETSTEAGGVKYVFTPESKINFVGSKVTGSHEGGFEKFEGYFHMEDGKPVGSDHVVTIDMTSVWTDADKLTEHLKAPDFFDVEKYPESKFEITGIEEASEGTVTVSGNLNFHGVTKNISFPATVSASGDAMKLSAKFDMNRKDFGVSYEGKKDDLIRDEVVIELILEATPEAAPAS